MDGLVTESKVIKEGGWTEYEEETIVKVFHEDGDVTRGR